MGAAERTAPAKVKFRRKKSSWLNAEVLVEILLEISLAMVEFPEFQPILVMDCATIHLSKRVLERAQVLGIWILPVPAKCTFLLQPCDTHVFSPYKAFLKRASRECKSADGVVTQQAWLQNFIAVARKFLCGRTWQHAFQQTSLPGDRSHLTRDLAALELQPAPQLHAARAPALQTVRELLPKDRRVPYRQLLSEPRAAPFESDCFELARCPRPYQQLEGT